MSLTRASAQARTLVVFVHGDVVAGGPADYLFFYAQRFASANVATVALLRPGYFDFRGNTSSGTNYNRSDSYTPENVDAVASAIRNLKQTLGAQRVVYVGHSGGAAYGGVIMGKYPGMVDAAVLLGCLCNIVQYRTEHGYPPWVRSLSPSDYVGGIAPAAQITAVNGSLDDNTYPHIAQEYVRSVQLRGIDANYVEISGAGHDFTTSISESPVFIGAVNRLINAPQM